jgi:hypothetical protein
MELHEQSRHWRRRALQPHGNFVGISLVPPPPSPRAVDALTGNCPSSSSRRSTVSATTPLDDVAENPIREHDEVVRAQGPSEPLQSKPESSRSHVQRRSSDFSAIQDTADRVSFAEKECLRRNPSAEFRQHRKSSVDSKNRYVDLAMYDLSKGLASWMPSVFLNGQKWEALWHTGVRAFGYEFWYGGDIVQVTPEVLPFGNPMRVVRLGTTQRRYQDLTKFIKEKLAHSYRKDDYDALQHNCNHFSNDMVRYLLHGQQIPAEVREQLEWYRNAALVQVLRPVLTHWLNGAAARGTVCSATREKDGSASEPVLVRSASFLGCCQCVTCPADEASDQGCVASLYRPKAASVQLRTQARPLSRDRGGVDDTMRHTSL